MINIFRSQFYTVWLMYVNKRIEKDRFPFYYGFYIDKFYSNHNKYYRSSNTNCFELIMCKYNLLLCFKTADSNAKINDFVEKKEPQFVLRIMIEKMYNLRLHLVWVPFLFNYQVNCKPMKRSAKIFLSTNSTSLPSFKSE